MPVCWFGGAFITDPRERALERRIRTGRPKRDRSKAKQSKRSKRRNRR